MSGYLPSLEGELPGNARRRLSEVLYLGFENPLPLLVGDLRSHLQAHGLESLQKVSRRHSRKVQEVPCMSEFVGIVLETALV